MLRERTVSPGIAQFIYQGALSVGVKPSDLNNIPAIAGSDFKQRLPVESLLDIFQLAADHTGDLSVGTRIGSLMRPARQVGAFYAATFCDTLLAATELIIHYQAVNQEMGQAHLEWSEGQAHYIWTPVIEDINRDRFGVEAAFVIYAQICQWQLWSQKPVVRSVHFRHSPPQDVSIYRKIYGSDPEFNAPRNEIIIDEETMKMSVPGRNPEILSMLIPRLDDMLKNLKSPTSPAEDCRNLVMQRLGRGPVTLEDISERMKMSARNLRRKLAEENTSFRQILEACRKETAQIYLADPKMPVTEVALSLGYNDQSAFTRAFKTWFDCSPLEYRQSL